MDISSVSEYLQARQPFRFFKGMFSAFVAYPLAERLEKRNVSEKLAELRRHYRLPFEKRLAIARDRLADTLLFAQHHVPYYQDLFRQKAFDPDRVRKDTGYLNELPFLDKDIIREQGPRLLSRPLAGEKYHPCKTGGSTGLSCVIYYDQTGADYSSAVTLYARERVGSYKYRPQLHFACRFPDTAEPTFFSWTREDFKCLAMNRSNIFFDRVDDTGLERMWRILKRRLPYLIHEHPSTIYALACYVEKQYGTGKAFDIFESSGELLEPYSRETIERVLQCRVINRYGLAELGVMAYEVDGKAGGLQVFDSEGWPENRISDSGVHELVFTGFRNRLMPLIRYVTGDIARVEEKENGFFLTDVVGRIHDVIPINGVNYPTHHVMDMLDHRVGGIQEFQVDLRQNPPVMRIVPEPGADTGEISGKINQYWPHAFRIEFVNHDGMIRVGHRAKFRHVVTK